MQNSMKAALITFFSIITIMDVVAGEEFPVLKGPYLGQKAPGQDAELFAPRIVSTGLLTRDMAMTPDGKEIYFSVAMANYSFATIIQTREINGRWTAPEVMPQMNNPKVMNLEPCISPDGKKFFFLSNRPDTSRGETTGDEDIWVMDRIGDHWSEPYNLGEPINTEHSEFFPSITNDGTIYFTRAEKGSRVNQIFRSRLINGQYQAPEKLPAQVNSGTSQFNAFIARDESYLIVPVLGRKDSYGGADYYIVFRNPNDTWNEPINMGEKINTAAMLEFSPYISPDGKYFFFMANRPLSEEKYPAQLTFDFLKQLHNQPQNGNASIYWIDAKVIENLKK
ncbi:PD40 domain-containing protein [candidate division KSB1 bacterium]|nr:PD40 domain-containing protein [candidate division KSB1 bacterium]